MQKTYPNERITGTRISLRSHTEHTAPAMFACIDADRQRLGNFMVWVDTTRSVQNSENYIRATMLDWQEYNIFDYGIYLGEEFIGTVGCHHISWQHESAEIGYWISGAHEGKGLVSEAVGLLEEELFRLGFYRLEIRCDSNNSRSAALPKRRGYQLEGILRRDCIEFGKRRDTMLWAKLRE